VCIDNKWTPKQIDKLEFQSENYRGLFFWYNEIIKQLAFKNSQNIT
jgi:hypothetical protein